ncbi:hypothetical protein Tco_0550336 [Tanacetum coccineum]
MTYLQGWTKEARMVLILMQEKVDGRLLLPPDDLLPLFIVLHYSKSTDILCLCYLVVVQAGLSGGQMAGISIGAVAGVLFFGTCFYLVLYRRKRVAERSLLDEIGIEHVHEGQVLFMKDIEFEKLQARNMLEHLWTRPISNASVEFVQVGASVEVRANRVTKHIPVSDGDVLYLESLLSDDNTYNLSSDVFFDHEPQHIKNESDHDTLITFSPKSDPLHHEFAGEVITIPPRIGRDKSCHLPIELEHKAYWALKHANFDLKTAGDHRKLQLNELNELRDQAYENSLIYKERTKKLHDSKIKNRIFNVGDRVLLFNSRLKIFSGKLKTRWSGPFTITKVFPYGTIELSQPDGPNFKVNGHRVKHYFGGDLPPKVVQDLQTFSKDE